MSSTPNSFRYRVESMKICGVKGSDSEDFLQRLLTNDIKLIAEQELQLGSWCNIKGRVSILIRVIRFQDDFMLLVDDFNLEKLIQSLNKFVFNSKVTITDLSNDFCAYVGFNNKVENRSNLLIKENRLTWEIEPIKDQSYDTLYSNIENHRRLFTLFCINNLIPSLPKDLCDKFLPQEINLDQLGGLSFNKGCFPGQEVIARVKYRGKQKKRLKKFISLQSHHGENSFNHLTNSSGNRLGVIVDAAKDENNYLHILAVSNEGDLDELYLDKSIPIIPNE